jgi:hypothetical protein
MPSRSLLVGSTLYLGSLRSRPRDAKPIQDHVVVSEQKWHGGIVSCNGRIRQFVAMPFGSGYSVEAQVTGEEVTGGPAI